MSHPARNSQSGFTLIELMIAIIIIAILATVGLVVYSSAQRTTRISKRLQDLQAIQQALELYRSANGGYPSNTGGNVIANVTCANSATALGLLSSGTVVFMPTVPTDPSGVATVCYLYYSTNTTGTSPDYKLRTNVASPEMTTADFLQQPNYIDPAKDNVPGTCNVETTGGTGTVSAWAVYTTGGCAY